VTTKPGKNSYTRFVFDCVSHFRSGKPVPTFSGNALSLSIPITFSR